MASLRGAGKRRHGGMVNGHSKRKKQRDTRVKANGQAKSARQSGLDDFFFAADSDDDKSNSDGDGGVADEFEHETPEERRLRLAKQVLEEIRKGGGIESDEDDDDEDDAAPGTAEEVRVERRLQRKVLQDKGTLQRRVAASFSGAQLPPVTILRGHKLSATCVALSDDDAVAFTGAKDGSIIEWDLTTQKKRRVHKGVPRKRKKGGASSSAASSTAGHRGDVLCLAASSDGVYLASGGTDKLVHLWDLRAGQICTEFKGHRDSVTGLAFRMDSLDLFSGSADRTVKVWNVAQQSYVETLFGHGDTISAVDSLRHNRVLTAGSDRSVRLFKIVEETQLLFGGGHKMGIDAACFVNEEKFLTASQDGALGMWLTRKKKPSSVISAAHGGQWLTSVAAWRYTDLCASGSSDGLVRLWDCSHKLLPMTQVPVQGFVNGLRFAQSGRFLAAAVGQEHRLGRWSRQREARNGLQIIQLQPNDDAQADDNDESSS